MMTPFQPIIHRVTSRTRTLHSSCSLFSALQQPSFSSGRTRKIPSHSCASTSTGSRLPNLKLTGIWPSLRHRTDSGILNFVESKIWNETHRDTRFRSSPLAASHRRGSPRHDRPGSGSKIPWLESIPSQVIFWGILVLNGIVYLSWGYSKSIYESLRDPKSYIWMSKNFLVNMQNVKEGRVWCLLTACFSHESTSHLFFNGLSYFFMAPPVLALLGNTGFLALYLGGGIFASVASLAWRSLKARSQIDSSHGASAAIYAVISFFACLQPRTTFLIFGVIPCPAWAWVTGIFLFDGYSAVTDKRSRIDSFGHISGLIAGAAYFIVRRAPFRL